MPMTNVWLPASRRPWCRITTSHLCRPLGIEFLPIQMSAQMLLCQLPRLLSEKFEKLFESVILPTELLNLPSSGTCCLTIVWFQHLECSVQALHFVCAFDRQ